METRSGVEGDWQRQKRKVKMTEKALADKLTRLQNKRKTKLNKAANIRSSMRSHYKGRKDNGLNCMNDLKEMCDQAKISARTTVGFHAM